jgi:hypothetical protein
MKKLTSGSILRIPLLKGNGFGYAKYIDLTTIDKDVSFPEIINVYDYRTDSKVENLDELELDRYLLSPIAVAGLRPTLKKELWEIIGVKALEGEDKNLPDFKGGNSTYEEIEEGEWFLYRRCRLDEKVKTSYETVKFLQPFAALGTGVIEIRLTMYHLIREEKRIEDFFDLADETYSWNFKQVLDSPMLF